jgi:FtsH-binding integral membrane protein
MAGSDVVPQYQQECNMTYKRPVLRVVLLAIAALLSVGITVIGALSMVSLNLQSVLLILIGASCCAGIALSTFARAWLQENAWLGRCLVCVAFALPALDIYALAPDPSAHRAMVGQAVISLLVGSIIALAISTAWIGQFNRTSLD